MVEEDTKGSTWRFLFKKVRELDSKRKDKLFVRVGRVKENVKEIVNSWQRVLDEVNRCKKHGEKVAFYGEGTTLSIIISNTEFPREQIVGIYDDNPHKAGEVFYGFEVIPACEEMKRAEVVFLCAGPDGIASMKRSIGDYHGQIIHL